MSRFFTKTDHGYQVSKRIRDLCIFAKHNVLADPPYSQVDLISCRNLLIYLRSSYQRRAFEIFHYALKPTGLLMLGRSETVGGGADELFTPVDKPTRIYAKKPTVRSPARFTPRLDVSSGIARFGDVAAPASVLEDLVKRADAALAAHTPPAVLINDAADILHFRGDTKPYLTPPSGPATSNLFRMASESLQLHLRAAIDAARRDHAIVRRGPIAVTADGAVRSVTLEVMPLALREGVGRHFVVLFVEESGKSVERVEVSPGDREARPPTLETGVDVLRRELRETRLQLEGTIHELESLNEEYRSAHEEALSANEELQSANEELETAKEELQSSNEELTTINDELQGRSAELSQSTNDLINVLTSVHMPVILVGADLRLRRFTPMATKVLNVIPSDVGRPISDITLNVKVPDLASLVLETIETMTAHERDVQDQHGHWYVVRVRPYRTDDYKIDGAVVMLVDVDELRSALGAAQGARDYAEAIVSTVREPLIVLDEKLRVLSANAGFYSTFHVAPDRTEGRLLYEIGDRQWDIPRLRELLEQIVPQHSTFENFEVVHDFPVIGPRTMLLNARRVEDTNGNPSRILLAIEDVSKRRHAEAERESLIALAQRARAEAEEAGNLLRRVQAITDTALLELSFEQLLQQILERVRETVGGDTAIILLREPREQGDEEVGEREVLRARAAVGLSDVTRRNVAVPAERGLAGRIAAERQPLVLDEVDHAQEVTPYLREEGIRSLVGVPLVTERGLLGVLHVGSVQPRKFSPKDVEILTLAAERIAHAVEIAERRQSEQRARAAADAANRAKDEFLALLSHELRNPLSAVRNAVTSARLDPAQRERALEIAGRQSEHLTRLVDDLLDVARITQGKIRLRRDSVGLRESVDRAIESARSFIETRGHTLSVSCSGDSIVDADPSRLEQIVENLITNAAKYTPAGGRIDIICEHADDEAILRVRDNGVGIAPDMLPRIFDLFAQADTALDRTQGGLGIGLTVVRRLVELHGGRIEARSEGLGHGAEFVVRLPAVPAHEHPALGQLRAPAVAGSVRVLIVEDNPDVAESMKVLLEILGHQVRVAYDGRSALDVVRGEVPDVALVDIGLPGMDGYEVARRLRAERAMEGVTLVALSGYGRDEDKERALAAGFHLHLTKPIDADRLIALMGEVKRG